MNASSEMVIKKVNRILRKNRRVLNTLNPENKTKIKLSQLTRKGFDMEHFTSIYRTREGKEYRFCYDQGYLMLGENYVLLVKRDIEN